MVVQLRHLKMGRISSGQSASDDCDLRLRFGSGIPPMASQPCRPPPWRAHCCRRGLRTPRSTARAGIGRKTRWMPMPATWTWLSGRRPGASFRGGRRDGIPADELQAGLQRHATCKLADCGRALDSHFKTLGLQGRGPASVSGPSATVTVVSRHQRDATAVASGLLRKVEDQAPAGAVHGNDPAG